MRYKSNRKEVKQAMDKAQKLTLEAIGKAGEAHVKLITPVGVYPSGSGRVGGALRDSISYKADDKSVAIGSTLTSENYPIYVHQGTSRQKAQPYIHDGIMKNLSNLKSIAEKAYKL